MKKQYIILFSSLLGITFILSGGIFAYTQSYKNEKSKTIESEKIIAEEIGNVYKTFFDKESELSSFRTPLMDSLNDYVSYYSTMPDTYDEMIEYLSDYENKIVEIENISSYLNEKTGEAHHAERIVNHQKYFLSQTILLFPHWGQKMSYLLLLSITFFLRSLYLLCFYFFQNCGTCFLLLLIIFPFVILCPEIKTNCLFGK